MTAMWFGLAAIALVGAVALLYIDRSRRDQVGRVRQMWAKAQGYQYAADDDRIVHQFRRAALAKPEQTTAVDVVRGVRRGEEFVLFDVEESATIVAVRRPVGSAVDIDLRLKSTPPPRDPDLELLGSIGPRIVFATDVEVARRVCDQRMAAFTAAVPGAVNLLWSENDWTLGSLPLGSTGRDWDAAVDAVTRLSGLLHVLPPTPQRQSGPDRRVGSDRPAGPPRRRGTEPSTQRPEQPYPSRPQGPHTQTPRTQTPRTQTPRTQTPRTQGSGREVPRSDSPGNPVRSAPVSRPRPVAGSRVERPQRPSSTDRDADRRPTDS